MSDDAKTRTYYWDQKEKMAMQEWEGKCLCHVCGKFSPLEVRQLCGGFFARLCVEHTNAWHEYMGSQEVFVRLLKVTAEYEWAKREADLELILATGEAYHKIRKECFAIAKQWMKDNTTPTD